MLDCLVIGGGPAGLTAAIYLARFRLSVAVIDAGKGRAASIPLTRNHAGYPEGIPGTRLLEDMRTQARKYGVEITTGEVTRLERREAGFVAQAGGAEVVARAVLLATGVVNNRPPMSDALHDAALASGHLRYCPICDGFEVTDKRIGVVGTGERGVKEAVFLRSYSRNVTLIALEDAHELSDAQRALLEDAGIVVRDGPTQDLSIDGPAITIATDAGPLSFDTIYPALGSVIRSERAAEVGADCSGDGCLLVDTHQRTTIPGLYAAGDVVMGLDQISHAMGEGGVAATTIRNDLAELAPLRR